LGAEKAAAVGGNAKSDNSRNTKTVIGFGKLMKRIRSVIIILLY
jgi:hypothetical protein